MGTNHLFRALYLGGGYNAAGELFDILNLLTECTYDYIHSAEFKENISSLFSGHRNVEQNNDLSVNARSVF